jgi:hypothetical protein
LVNKNMFERISQQQQQEAEPLLLSDRERQEKMEGLLKAVEHIAVLLNTELEKNVKDRKGNVPLVDSTGRINKRAYSTKAGGPYKKEGSEDAGTQTSVTEDERFVFEREMYWYHVTDKKTQKYLGVENEESVFAELQRRNLLRDGMLGEMLVFTILHKVFGERFIVVRTADYDDYKNGADTLVVHKETGGIACTFDEVVDEERGDLYKEKEHRVIQRGEEGFFVKYGLDVEGGQIVRTSRNNVVGVPLRISKEDLYTLLKENVFQENVSTETERNVLVKMFQEAALHAGEDREGVEALLAVVKKEIVDGRQ